MNVDFAQQNYQPKIKIRKDYQKKQFVNPYFDSKKAKGGFNTKLYLKIIAIILIIYVVLYSDLFKIENIEIQGAEMISQVEFRQIIEQELSAWRWYLLPQKNLILLSKKWLENKIRQKYSLNKLTIDKNWRTLKINLQEKISYLIIYNQENFYFADLNGATIRAIPQKEIDQYWDKFPLLNIGQKPMAIGEVVASDKVVNFILRLNEQIKNAKVAIYGYELGEGERVTLVAKDGWRAYFDLASDPKIAVENLVLVLKEKINNPEAIEYIDLRFGNRVYYK